MVKHKDHLHIPLPPQTLDMAMVDDQIPVTPVNRSFTAVEADPFVTAILSPNSNEVFAARARARSRSDAPAISADTASALTLNTVHYSPSLDSIGTARPCNTIIEADTSPCEDGNMLHVNTAPSMQALKGKYSVSLNATFLHIE